MATISESFTATGNGGQIGLAPGDELTYVVSGTWVGTIVLERTENNGLTWEPLVTSTANVASATLVNVGRTRQAVRFRCKAFTSGTIVTSLAETAVATGEFGGGVITTTEAGASVTGTLAVSGTATFAGSVVRAGRSLSVNAAGKAKVGATAGWVVAAADNVALVTCPASQTASTLVLPLHNLNVGDTITGFSLVGQVESAGGTVTIDARSASPLPLMWLTPAWGLSARCPSRLTPSCHRPTLARPA